CSFLSPDAISRRLGTSRALPNTSRMNTFLHALFGIAATLMTWRALEQAWVGIDVPRSGEDAAIRFALPVAIAFGSALSLVAGRLGKHAARAFRHDALSFVGVLVAILVLAVG